MLPKFTSIYLIKFKNFRTKTNRTAMKVIFLDIDGVVSPFLQTKFEASKMKLIKDIITKTNANVVLSSNWRLTKRTRIAATNEFEKYSIVLFACTNYNRNLMNTKAENRGIEIKQWIEASQIKIESFVVIDDLDVLKGDPHFFRGKVILTNGFIGITEEEAVVATKILNLK